MRPSGESPAPECTDPRFAEPQTVILRIEVLPLGLTLQPCRSAGQFGLEPEVSGPMRPMRHPGGRFVPFCGGGCGRDNSDVRFLVSAQVV